MPVAIRLAGIDSEQLPRIVAGREAAPLEWLEWAEEPGHDLVALFLPDPETGGVG